MAITYSDEVLAAMKQAQEDFQHHAELIGVLCISWAALDHALDPLFTHLLQCSEKQVACFAANIEQVGLRCEILKRLLIVEAPSQNWREWLTAILDRVSGELAPIRNRCIHDAWSRKDGKMTRTDRRLQIGKSQSRQPDTLIYNTEHVMPADQVERLLRQVEAVTGALEGANRDLRKWRETGQPVEPDPQLVPVCKRTARYWTDQERAEAQKLGQTPSGYKFD